jgi:hypothetical protein
MVSMQHEVLVELFKNRPSLAAELLAESPWCSQPIDIGVRGFVLQPPVLGRESIPKITDVAEALRRPELALLSAMAHGDTAEAHAIAEAASSAFAELDDKRSGFYQDILYNSINEAARHVLEAKMKGYEYTSPFMKKAIQEGRDEGMAHAVLTVLRARGINVPEATRHRMLAERDPVRLERWIERAVAASSVEEVLAEPS